MKKKMKRFWLIAMCVATLSVISAMPASADVSRVVYFSIQNNINCDNTNVPAMTMFTISNISSSDSNVTLDLFMNDGTPMTHNGINGTGMSSTFTPGQPFDLLGKSTGHYAINFGATTTQACSEIPAYGRITVNSETGLFVASGETRSFLYTTNPHVIYSNIPITINGGQPF